MLSQNQNDVTIDLIFYSSLSVLSCKIRVQDNHFLHVRESFRFVYSSAD